MVTSIFLTLLAIHLGPMGPDAPARGPQMAVKGSTVALAFGAGDSIYIAISRDSGRTFSDPQRVAEASIVPLTRHRGPRIAWAGRAIVITAVTGKTSAGPHAHGLPSDGDLIAWRSLDGGKTWSKGTVINDVAGAPNEGLHALASDGDNRLFAAWLDHRSGHGTQLYGSESHDSGRTWSKNVLIYSSPEGTICECCHPSLTMEPDGAIAVMWRNWLKGSRDLYLARSREGVRFSTAEKLGDGTWKLNACPMDGGGLVISNGKTVTAWRRQHTLFLDTPGQPEKRIADGTDVALTSGANGIYAIWSSASGVEAMIPGKSEAVNLAPKGSFPNVAALPSGGAVAAWEQDGQIATKIIRSSVERALGYRASAK